MNFPSPKGFPEFPADWTSEWETFQSADGSSKLFSTLHHRREWTEPSALLVMHGLHEHGGRYSHFPHYVKDVVQAVSCLDHRGHGRSEGLRGHVDRFDRFTDDALVAVRRLDEALRARFGSSEIHLFAHSMGCLVALRLLLQNPSLPIRSVTLAAPLLGIAVKVPAAKRLAGQVLSRVWGSVHMSTEVEPSELTRDTELHGIWAADRLIHKKVTPRLYTELQAAIADTVARDAGILHPLQFILAGKDTIVENAATEGFYEKLQAREKLLKTYPANFHESFNDIDKEKAFEDLTAWIRKHR